MASLRDELERLSFKDEDTVRRIAARDFNTNEVKAARILVKALEKYEKPVEKNQEPDIINLTEPEDSYPNHPGRPGGGSLPGGGGPQDIRGRAKKNPHIRNGLDGDDSSFIVTGFRKGKLEPHFKKHGDKMGFKTEKEYQQAGTEFMEGPLSEMGEEITMRDGRRCRVDHGTGYLGVVNADGSLKTFYDPKQYKQTTVDIIEGWIKEDERDRNKG